MDTENVEFSKQLHIIINMSLITLERFTIQNIRIQQLSQTINVNRIINSNFQKCFRLFMISIKIQFLFNLSSNQNRFKNTVRFLKQILQELKKFFHKPFVILKGISILISFDVEEREESMNMRTALLTEFISAVNSCNWCHRDMVISEIQFLGIVWKLFIELSIKRCWKFQHIVIMSKCFDSHVWQLPYQFFSVPSNMHKISNYQIIKINNQNINNIINLLMNLNKLLKTLKSQKTEKNESTPLKDNKPQQYIQAQQYCLPLQQLQTASENFYVQAPIKTIRYFVLKDIPALVNRIRGCGISFFNALPFSNRKVKQIDLKTQSFPEYLNFLKPLLEKEIPTYNHLLINDYPQQIGIMPHHDGPMYRPKVFVLSLNSYALINFQKTVEEKEFQCRVLLEPNSIHIFEEQAYVDYLHGIENYGFDSVLLFYQKQQKKVLKCSISNFNQLKCKPEIMSRIENCKEQQKIHEYEYENVRVLKIQDNLDYNWKIEFKRSQRISITIRQKYQ